jgi:hypothetical protein
MSAAVAQAAKLSVTPRLWHQRGHADHGWLKTYHTFNFASYYDPAHESFSNLRVINEDRVAAGTGFGRHPHREAEIFSVVLSGSLAHQDSLGNVEVLKRGDVQFTCAGTGIAHSERNGGTDEVHFLQVWSMPEQRGLTPAYYTTHADDAQRRDTLRTLVRPAAEHALLVDGAIPSHSALVARAALLSPAASVIHVLGTHAATAGERWAYVHLAQTSGYRPPSARSQSSPQASIAFNDGLGSTYTLAEGDGAYLRGGIAGDAITFTNTGSRDAEFLVFDLKPQPAHH